MMAKEKAVAKMRGQGGEVEVEEEKRRNSASTRNTKGLNCELWHAFLVDQTTPGSERIASGFSKRRARNEMPWSSPPPPSPPTLVC